MTFAFNAASSTRDATSTTRTVDLTGWMSPTAGDAIIVWAGGRGTANTFSFTPSGGGGGWVDIGSIVRCDFPSGPYGQRYGAMHAWFKVADGTETSVTVTRSGGNQHRAGAALFRSPLGEVAEILAGPNDHSTGSAASSTYTPPSFVAPRTLNVIEIVQAHTDVSGSMATANAQGFTAHLQGPAGSTIPICNIYEQIVTAGTITMPTSGSIGVVRPWVSKTFALAAQLPPPTGGWSVGSIRWGFTPSS